MLSKVDAFASDPSAFVADNERIEQFITRWQGREGGQERANYVLFLTELCTALGLPQPDPAGAQLGAQRLRLRACRDAGGSRRLRVLSRGSTFTGAGASSSRRSSPAWLVRATRSAGQLDLPDMPSVNRGKKSAERAWDVLMFNARQQAEGYVRLLPTGHEPPPFLIVCDVGHCFEVYANFPPGREGLRPVPRPTALPDLSGRSPPRGGARAASPDLDRSPGARPCAAVSRRHPLDRRTPRRRLKGSGGSDHPAEDVAAFLMRCLFTMFAEDVGLLPVASFKKLLERCEADPSKFVPLVGQLWEAMDKGGFAFAIEANVRKFNGKFFKQRDVLPLDREEIGELRRAASYSWREVDPSIFGTLLEQALDAGERRRLGAHYTPRAYVERLVVATVIEPLRQDWLAVYSTADLQKAEGRLDEARRSVSAFHDRLCATRVLDPACGTGNFLYVALELMKRLEGEVLDALQHSAARKPCRGWRAIPLARSSSSA